MQRAVLLSFVVSALCSATAMAAEPAEGEKTFRRLCSACHVVEEGKNRLGPSLHRIVGRKAGTVPGFRYSDANQKSEVVWTTEHLDEYLKDPKAYMPGNRMAFAGVKKDEDRANVIAYLETLK